MSIKQILIDFDEKWCGCHQIKASLLSNITEDENTPLKLASFRLFLALSLFIELLGYFFVTLGLSGILWVFLLGIFFMIAGSVTAAIFQNKAGIFLSLELQKYLKQIALYSLEIRSFLADRGCSESEINALHSLPIDVYQSELNGYQKSRILNVGAPLLCGAALFMNGEIFTSVVVVILGLCSFPIGERFFKENTFRRESELRLGLAAQLLDYVNKKYQEHLWLTTKVNFFAQLPLLLFACRFVWNASGQLLSGFFGLTQGLVGLTGTLAFQKARVMTTKTTAIASHLIHALSSSHLIVSPQRWKEHCKNHAHSEDPPLTQYKNGVMIQNFAPNMPFKETEVFSVSCFIPSGSVCILKALSGKGKTTFLSALTHLLEHTGELVFIKDDQSTNAHTLSRKEFDYKTFFFREVGIDKSARLIDLFKEITFVENEAFLEQSKTKFDSLLVDLAWKSPDNLLEQEIKNIESDQHSAFSYQMLDFLKELRKKQSTQISAFLQQSDGNLATERIFPERNFATLSSGEKRRLVILIALETCRTMKTPFVILDEPLTHLDEMNIQYQLQMILKMQKLDVPPSILIISHHFLEEMKKTLPQIQEICLFST